MHFFNTAGWMELNKHYIVCVFTIIMSWQVHTLSNSSAADLSFSSFVVFGSVKMVEPFLGFRDVKLQTFKLCSDHLYLQLQESLPTASTERTLFAEHMKGHLTVTNELQGKPLSRLETSVLFFLLVIKHCRNQKVACIIQRLRVS